MNMKTISMGQIKVLFSHQVKAQVKRELNLLMNQRKEKKNLSMEEDN